MNDQARVGAIVFFVSDLARSCAWYRSTLDLDVRMMEGHDGPFAMASAGPVELVLLPREEPAGRSPIVVFALERGIYEAVEALVAQGVEIVLPVSPTPDGGLSSDFLDPDGHVLSFYQAGGVAS
ncbi:MAG: VOC family protein [Xanthomonadales bacterium]|nr:VOC family protein [Xanthomonadales bacterium]